MSLPPDLYNRLLKALLRCEAFESDRALRAIFADARIDSWRHRIPHADSPDERAKKVVDYLHRQADEHGQNALILLLRVLSEQMPPTDARHQELADLADELEREFELHPPQPEAPETLAQKFTHFFTGDTEVQRAYRNRQAMLKLVHNTWIKGVLEQSLHGAALIELGMEYDPTAVDHPWDMVVQMAERPDRQLPPGTRIVDVFDEVGGSLLILGEPGSGKTTMLLELARDLIARAEEDPLQPIPVVFNLSSWVIKQQPLAEWLVEELRTKYHIPKKIAQSWVKDDVLLLLLDGLDEVKAEARDKCVTAINAFRDQHFVPLAVCSRSADYEALTAQLCLQGAVYLRSLTPAQIDAYLSGASVELQAVHTTLQHDPVLREMAESPLFLSIMTLAYHGKTITDFQSLATPEIRCQHLFDAYIEQMFRRRSKEQLYTQKQVINGLALLAQKMFQTCSSMFSPEQIQVNWLNPLGQLLYAILAIAIPSAIIGIIGWYAGYQADITSLTRSIQPHSKLYAYAGAMAPIAIALLNSALTRQMKSSFEEVIWNLFGVQTVEYLTISKTRNKLMLSGSLTLFFVTLYLLFSRGTESLALSLLSFLSLVSTLVVPIVVEGRQLEEKLSPSDGLQLSVHNFVVIMGVMFLPGFLYMMVGKWYFSNFFAQFAFAMSRNLFFAMLFAPFFGGYAVVRHYILRLILLCNDQLPWRIARFFDYAADRIFLRRVGGGYIFVHRLLQEHFASLTPEDIERIAGDTRATG